MDEIQVVSKGFEVKGQTLTFDAEEMVVRSNADGSLSVMLDKVSRKQVREIGLLLLSAAEEWDK